MFFPICLEIFSNDIQLKDKNKIISDLERKNRSIGEELRRVTQQYSESTDRIISLEAHLKDLRKVVMNNRFKVFMMTICTLG
jgi:predicted transcriptional regulator